MSLKGKNIVFQSQSFQRAGSPLTSSLMEEHQMNVESGTG